MNNKLLNATQWRLQSGLQFVRPTLAAAAIVLSAVSLTIEPAAARDLMKITLNKSKFLRFSDTVKTVVVGKSTIADATVHSYHHLLITAKAVGETDLIVLSKTGQEIASFHLIVVPEIDRHMTIHRSPDTVATYSCAPRCTVVESPDSAEKSTRSPARTSAASPGQGTSSNTVNEQETVETPETKAEAKENKTSSPKRK